MKRKKPGTLPMFTAFEELFKGSYRPRPRRR